MTDRRVQDSGGDFRWLETRLENVVNMKASKEFVASELARIRDQVYMVRDKMDQVDNRVNRDHVCNQTGVFQSINSRLESIKSDLDANATSIKKIYIWQAGVGISLLVFFLTMGVAALRYVDKIDFAVKQNQVEILRLEKKVEKETLNKQELKKVLRETLISTSNFQ